MTTNLLEVNGLSVHFPQKRSMLDVVRRRPAAILRAVQDVDLTLAAGATLGLVGESGCGKSTLGRALLGLTGRVAGEIRFEGRAIDDHLRDDPLAFRRGVQMVFQDPSAALNPKMTIGGALTEALRVHRMCAPAAMPARVAELLEAVGLSPDLARRRPRALSGGQCQRVGIARALAVKPRVIIADEAVSALDVSVQAQILNLLARLQREHRLAMLFVSHDLSVVRHICRDVAVMYLGRIVESGSAEAVFAEPKHPYTQALIQAKPRLDGPSLKRLELLGGEPPSPLALPPGCAFSTRCARVMPRCRETAPKLARRSGSVDVACHLYEASSPEKSSALAR